MNHATKFILKALVTIAAFVLVNLVFEYFLGDGTGVGRSSLRAVILAITYMVLEEIARHLQKKLNKENGKVMR